MKEIKKYDVFKMKMITDSRKKNDFSTKGINYPNSSRDNVKKPKWTPF